MASILFVSKPIAPPWNDSGKNLVRDLARGLTRHQATLMVRPGSDADAGAALSTPVYAAHSGGFAPGLSDQARVFSHLLTARGHALWHFFFAPNPKSNLAGRISTSLRGKRAVHTISSAPRDVRAIVPQLFAEQNVVLSRHTEQRFLDAGLSPSRLVRIAPAIEPLTPKTDAERDSLRSLVGLPSGVPLLVYPGDLEFGEGGTLAVESMGSLAAKGVHLAMACRTKTPRAKAAEGLLREQVKRAGFDRQVHWLGETSHIHALLATADVVCLASTDLYAKMDYPLVLLEAMSLGRPVIVAKGSAAAEIAEGDAAIAIEPTGEALASATTTLLDDMTHVRALGARAVAAVQQRYSHRVMASAYEALYDRMLLG